MKKAYIKSINSLNKQQYPALCLIGVTQSSKTQQLLLSTMRVDLMAASINPEFLMPVLLAGLKRFHDAQLLQLSQTLLHSMAQMYG